MKRLSNKIYQMKRKRLSNKISRNSITKCIRSVQKRKLLTKIWNAKTFYLISFIFFLCIVCIEICAHFSNSFNDVFAPQKKISLLKRWNRTRMKINFNEEIHCKSSITSHKNFAYKLKWNFIATNNLQRYT